jgi:hypothetical protein
VTVHDRSELSIDSSRIHFVARENGKTSHTTMF